MKIWENDANLLEGCISPELVGLDDLVAFLQDRVLDIHDIPNLDDSVLRIAFSDIDTQTLADALYELDDSDIENAIRYNIADSVEDEIVSLWEDYVPSTARREEALLEITAVILKLWLSGEIYIAFDPLVVDDEDDDDADAPENDE